MIVQVLLGMTLAMAGGALAFAVLLIATLLVVQPGNAKFRDHAALLANQPYIIFWAVSKLCRWANVYQQIKPAPLRVAEVTVAYLHSQVLFVIVNLGIADFLIEGPKTAQQLAEAAGPQTNAEWLARVLKLAAELGLVSSNAWCCRILQHSSKHCPFACMHVCMHQHARQSLNAS
jgi:hypothetical protein